MLNAAGRKDRRGSPVNSSRIDISFSAERRPSGLDYDQSFRRLAVDVVNRSGLDVRGAVIDSGDIGEG